MKKLKRTKPTAKRKPGIRKLMYAYGKAGEDAFDRLRQIAEICDEYYSHSIKSENPIARIYQLAKGTK